ncbi:class I SAM-dependent methyltransferase [Arthrobacter sp. KK5.5]|uniref:class I SAM-dependent methyltransferase n=1 Tax=Arthrobacter sp. KK5.5 TaxID=3373084 RepID=UPI003EE6E771
MVQKAQRLGGRMRPGRPVGNVTRGTTNPNRMRRVDRWITGTQGWRLRQAVSGPVAVDLGYGASGTTAVELFERLRAVRPDIRLLGLEIEPDRVAAALPLAREGLEFRHGGFEVPVDPDPVLIRAFNVLRQYSEDDVPGIWDALTGRLADHGLLVEGTCDEIGRRAAWVAVDAAGPRTLTVSMRFGGFALPSDVADRLPKALIHRNVPGERVHGFLRAADAAWLAAAPLAPYGYRQRWMAMCAVLKAADWPVRDGAGRWRLGEITVDWECVAPRTGALGRA